MLYWPKRASRAICTVPSLDLFLEKFSWGGATPLRPNRRGKFGTIVERALYLSARDSSSRGGGAT